jgi:protein transport protein SEC24
MSADQVAIATLLANKAVERGMNSKLDDARDALTNKCVDILGVYKTHMTASSSGATPNLQICDNLKLLPLLTLGMLKHVSWTCGCWESMLVVLNQLLMQEIFFSLSFPW